ncbi:hypothetical protein SASPL_145309 [Salvia splendens]|uniref:H15 domain-containing protein n=1 Tax=Salvia splendens TaxID=180675 RepID=A0A8X8WIM1_SALSN|nr:hypothetical protein SASPL_145309 [Salvia splendens]
MGGGEVGHPSVDLQSEPYRKAAVVPPWHRAPPPTLGTLAAQWGYVLAALESQRRLHHVSPRLGKAPKCKLSFHHFQGSLSHARFSQRLLTNKCVSGRVMFRGEDGCKRRRRSKKSVELGGVEAGDLASGESTILKDPEFTTVLWSRSNVDHKDKWRNLNCMANGLGSRHRARVSIKGSQLTPKREEDTTTSSMVVDKDEVLGVTSIAASNEISQDVKFKKNISRMDDVILEAITKLKEPRGSSRPTIMQYVEENYSTLPELERTLAANLKILTENGRLIKCFADAAQKALNCQTMR